MDSYSVQLARSLRRKARESLAAIDKFAENSEQSQYFLTRTFVTEHLDTYKRSHRIQTDLLHQAEQLFKKDAPAAAADDVGCEEPAAAADDGGYEEPAAAADDGGFEEPAAAADDGGFEEPAAAADDGGFEEPAAAADDGGCEEDNDRVSLADDSDDIDLGMNQAAPQRTEPVQGEIIMEEPLKGKAVMEKTNPYGARELAPSDNQTSVPQTFSSATNTGEKRKREGLVSRERGTGNSSDSEEVILVGDTTAIKVLGFDGGKQSQRSVFSERQAFGVQSNIDGNGSLEKEETGEEPERPKQVSNFNDFDKLREESNFAVGQTWALYDTVDGMPRLYAQIREVSVPGFDVTVTWLEPDPCDKEPIQRYEKDLPVSVGSFKLGKDETIKDHRRFSHEVHCIEGSSAGKFSVYPRKGETWAVFRGHFKSVSTGFDVNWSADPDSPWKYQYAFVEIVSEDAGSSEPLSAGFLHKAKGFLSLFCRSNEEIVTTYVRRSDDDQFSHRVPSFKTTGKEAEGVPRGAYELDPAALPANIKEIDVPLHLLAEPTESNSEP